MTKDDLKTLAMLPKVIQVLRKLSAQTLELQQLGAMLKVLPQEPDTWTHPSSHPLPTPPPSPTLAVRLGAFVPPPPGVLPDFTPPEELPPHLVEAKLRRHERLQEIRSSPERASKLQQFAHDGPEEEAKG